MTQENNPYKAIFFYISLYVFLFFPVICLSKGNNVRITGSTTVLPIISRAAEKFRIQYPYITVTVNAGGSGVGFSSIIDNRADIGMMSRKVSKEELKKNGSQDLNIYTLGRDGVACVISSEVYSSGIRTLSKKQIQDIFSGKVKNWGEIKGPDKTIVVIDKERHRGTRHAFMNYIFGNPVAKARGARLVVGSNNEEQAKIAQSDSAIGMLSQAWINKDVIGVSILQREMKIEPSIKNIKSGIYPITRDLDIVTQKNVSDSTQLFIKFLLSPKVRSLIEKSGYVPIR